MRVARPIVTSNSPDADRLFAVDSTPSGSQHLLEAVLQVCRKWLQHLPADDRRRENLNITERFVENLLESGDEFLGHAMANTRALLCVNCRRLDAAPAKCSERSLDRCPLLQGIGE
ncbi:MAG: hypothetical protein M0Z99_19285 [Betaproteobacteria bacterium]|nr:hypothetical protein [Betaproteobacteria bacterium]